MSEQLKAWWQARSTREQRLLAALGGVALIALLLVAVVKPLQAARSESLADIRTYQALAAQLRAMPAGAAPTPAVPRRTGDPAAILAATAAEAGLVLTISDTKAEAVDVPYDAVLRWIAATEASSSLRLRSITITPGGGPARVALTAQWSA